MIVRLTIIIIRIEERTNGFSTKDFVEIPLESEAFFNN